MHSLSLALVLAAAPAPAIAPAMVTEEAPRGPAVAPVPVTAPAALATSSSAPPAGRIRLAAPVPQAAVEKMGQGDRAYLGGDYRAALFAYQDAVYLAPNSATARVKLGRAYLALRYPPQAAAQAEQALALEPGSADARKLLDDAKAAPPRPAQATAAAPRTGVTAVAVSTPHVYRFADPEAAVPAAATAVAVGTSAAPRPAASVPSSTATSRRMPETTVAIVAASPVAAAISAPDPEPAPAQLSAQLVAPGPAAGASAAAGPVSPPVPGGPTAAQRYRAALELLANREYEKAANELTQAIVLDPRLAVAYAARASARFGLGRYREAADDYQAALSLDANLGTPLYGLAECYRVLGDGRRASEMYQRYADSAASDVREDLRAISAKRAQELR